MYFLVTFGHSYLLSHTSLNQSKLVFLPSNAAATTHKKNCSTSSNSIKSFSLNVSTKVLNMAQALICLFDDISRTSYIRPKK